ncbi:hypothetical protein [Chryseobacterium indologenes]|nr:hypothetical protein [Chryseobacterium indologenes]MEB4760310.1 hypothetical protein [Chryseobacterium indologenes]
MIKIWSEGNIGTSKDQCNSYQHTNDYNDEKGSDISIYRIYWI